MDCELKHESCILNQTSCSLSISQVLTKMRSYQLSKVESWKIEPISVSSVGLYSRLVWDQQDWKYWKLLHSQMFDAHDYLDALDSFAIER